MGDKVRAVQRRRSWLASVTTAAATAFVVLLLYVLSYGPACDALANGELHPKLFSVTYYPINWTCQRSPGAAYVMGSYRLMWDRREWPKNPAEEPPPPGPRRLTPRWRW